MALSRRQLLASALLAQSSLKIVIAGGHPGDPECGCGGTVARYTALGAEVVLLYLIAARVTVAEQASAVVPASVRRKHSRLARF